MDFLAPAYDFFVRFFFGKSLIEAQCMHINNLPKLRNALLVGGGTGKMVLQSKLMKKVSSLTYAELSGEMLDKARENLAPLGDKVSFLQMDARLVREKFDAIITPFVLDFYEKKEVRQWVRSIANHLNEGGHWLYTDFRPAMTGRKAMFVRGLHVFFAATCGIKAKTITDVREYAQAAGFMLVDESISRGGWFESLLFKKMPGEQRQ